MQSNKINLYINKSLKKYQETINLGKLMMFSEKPKNQITINDKNAISFSCNDYLGLSLNRSVIKAAEVATKKFGVGAGASRLVTGNNYLYSLLENKIKKLKKTSACCVFGSGFLANIGVISSLMNKKT